MPIRPTANQVSCPQNTKSGRVLRVLEEAAERLQIVILTSHPEGYEALREARFLDLEELLRR